MICRYKIKFISDIEQKIRKLLVNIAVAPFVGVWIEIPLLLRFIICCLVAPFVGVWIEICILANTPHFQLWSLPSWECGLKFHAKVSRLCQSASLPSWECGLKFYAQTRCLESLHCRSLRGSVD